MQRKGKMILCKFREIVKNIEIEGYAGYECDKIESI